MVRSDETAGAVIGDVRPPPDMQPFASALARLLVKQSIEEKGKGES